MAGTKPLVASVALLVISALIRSGESAVAIQKEIEKPAKYAGDCGCYSNDLDVVLKEGVDVNPIDGFHCRSYHCNEDGTTFIYTCGVAVAAPECTATTDLSKAYPECCKKFVCPGSVSTN